MKQNFEIIAVFSLRFGSGTNYCVFEAPDQFMKFDTKISHFLNACLHSRFYREKPLHLNFNGTHLRTLIGCPHHFCLFSHGLDFEGSI
jgi:hypothetical protein